MAHMTFFPFLKDYLKKEGTIYTVRPYRSNTEFVFVPDLGVCKRRFVKEIHTVEDLDPFFRQSGFELLGDWWGKVLDLYSWPDKQKYLYKVDVFLGEYESGRKTFHLSRLQYL